MVWAQVVRRGSRSLALLLGLLIACAGFTVLTGQVRSSSLRTVGQIKVTRSAYDILVRPKGAQSALERKDSLVQAGFLTQVHGGISMAQWHSIQKIPGVQVAAPVAVVGYVTPKVQIPVGTMSMLGGTRNMFRVDATWTTDNGVSTEVSKPDFEYFTQQKLDYTRDGSGSVGPGADGTNHVLCRQTNAGAPWTVSSASTIGCNNPSVGRSVANIAFTYPFLVEAIDPVAEAQLAGLKSAMATGSYLKSEPLRSRVFRGAPAQVIPVIMASTPATHMTVKYKLVRLPASAADRFSNGSSTAGMAQLKGTVVASGAADQSSIYPSLLRNLPGLTTPGEYDARNLTYLYTAGGTSYTSTTTGTGRLLRPRTVVNKQTVWANPGGGFVEGSLIPAGGDDTAFRSMAGYQWTSDHGRFAPAFVRQGTFDASKLPGYSGLSQVPLGTYASTVVTGATPKDRNVLGGKALPASPNIAGYVQPAPLMLTTLSALPAFEDPDGYGITLPGDAPGTPPTPVNAAAPISSIRIRVAGVHGIDATSRARVRLAAGQIQSATGLSVDVTVGSSPAPQTVVLAAGQHGRPQLSVHENWVKKGVALAIVSAINKKSLALFLLVLVVCALFVTNIAAASVRARRTELGVLACVGWTRTRLFALVATELGLIALVAGVGGALVAWGSGAALGIPITPARAGLSIPVALAVALVAGLIPAWRAAHAPPLEAVRSTASLPRRGAEPETVAGMAWVNVTRTRARSILAAAGLAVAVAALTVIVGVLVAFRGAVVGTLLGSAVTVQVRGSDYAAVAAIIILAGIGVTNVLFLGIRERGAEIATLRAVGWTETTLTRLLVLEGLFLGISGSLVGAVIGIGVLVVFVSIPATTITLTVLIAIGTGVLIAVAATLPATATLRTLPTALLLTEE